MDRSLVKRVIDTAYHRNGVGGEPFDVLMFQATDDEVMLGVVFPEPGHVAVLSMRLLKTGVIAFGANSHRGDQYEPQLRELVAAREQERAARISLTCDDCRKTYPGPAYYTLGTGYYWEGESRESRLSETEDVELVGDPNDLFDPPRLVHKSDKSACTANLCPRCAGPYLEPDDPDDPRRLERPTGRRWRGEGPGHASASSPGRAFIASDGTSKWVSCLRCAESEPIVTSFVEVEEDGTFGTRSCATCDSEVEGR